jgi:excisionase family DNA binding protein
VEEDAYTPGQAAKILKVSDGYVRRLVQRLASKL